MITGRCARGDHLKCKKRKCKCPCHRWNAITKLKKPRRDLR